MDYRKKLNQIKIKMLHGDITYERAREMAQPLIDEMNEKAKAIAKKNGMRHKKFTFAYLMR